MRGETLCVIQSVDSYGMSQRSRIPPAGHCFSSGCLQECAPCFLRLWVHSESDGHAVKKQKAAPRGFTINNQAPVNSPGFFQYLWNVLFFCFASLFFFVAFSCSSSPYRIAPQRQERTACKATVGALKQDAPQTNRKLMAWEGMGSEWAIGLIPQLRGRYGMCSGMQACLRRNVSGQIYILSPQRSVRVLTVVEATIVLFSLS